MFNEIKVIDSKNSVYFCGINDYQIEYSLLNQLNSLDSQTYTNYEYKIPLKFNIKQFEWNCNTFIWVICH